jgi:hypothetical protein
MAHGTLVRHFPREFCRYRKPTMALYDYVQKEPLATRYDPMIPGVISTENASFLFLLACALLFLVAAVL